MVGESASEKSSDWKDVLGTVDLQQLVDGDPVAVGMEFVHQLPVPEQLNLLRAVVGRQEDQKRQLACLKSLHLFAIKVQGD